MQLRSKLREMINRNDKLYAIERVIRNMDDHKLIELILNYYKSRSECTSITISHNGEKYPTELIYYIPYWWENGALSITGIGFCAALRRLLELLFFSDHFRFTPVVYWGNVATYYDSSMDTVTKNAFEYYFEPVSNIDYREIGECKNIIEAGRNGRFFINSQTPYSVTQDEINLLADIYRKHIHPNEKTRDYIDENVKSILKHEKVLGVHVRGTDYNRCEKDIPIPISAEEFLITVRNITIQEKYDQIFIATDDANILKAFRCEFEDRLLFYSDTFRSDTHNGVQTTISDRPLHQYKLGLEVLRDIYTLANCDSLVCGLSQVAFAARYVNIAIGRRFNKVVVIDHGVNEENGIEAIKMFKQKKREKRRENK